MKTLHCIACNGSRQFDGASCPNCDGIGRIPNESPSRWQRLRALVATIRHALHNIAFPTFDCEDCIGMGPQHGCYCSATDAGGPGRGPNRLQRFARWVLAA